MTVPSRRTVYVRLGQLLLLALWAWLLVRTTRNTVYPIVFPPGKPLPAFRSLLPPLHGDPIPWSYEELAYDRPDEILCLPDGRPNGWLVMPNPSRTWDRTWRVIDPYAPVVGLLFALAIPPMLIDRRTGPHRWHRWELVAVAGASGGLLVGMMNTVLFTPPMPGWTGDRGMYGIITTVANEFSVTREARTVWNRLGREEWYEWLPPGTLFGLVVGGMAAAGALRPWRPRPQE